MGVSKQSFQKLCLPFSFMKCSFFLFIFLLFIIIILGLAAVIVIFIVKPQKPIFSLETLRVVSVDVNAYSNSTLFVSSVISLVLSAQNPNKFGIKFAPARFHVYIEELPVGVIRVPGFNQPARSHNVNVATRVFVHCLNVSQMISGDLSQDESRQNVAQIKLLGDIRLHLQLLHITMPKIKVFLECSLNLDYRQLTFINEIQTTKVAQIHNESLPVHSKSFFNKCDIAVYI